MKIKRTIDQHHLTNILPDVQSPSLVFIDIFHFPTLENFNKSESNIIPRFVHNCFIKKKKFTIVFKFNTFTTIYPIGQVKCFQFYRFAFYITTTYTNKIILKIT